MRYSDIVREVLNRLTFHATQMPPNWSEQQPLLHGLKIRASGEARIDGDKDLPRLTIIDLNVTEKAQPFGGVTLFLDTKPKHGWVRQVDDATLGLVDWTERVMDAIDTKPSDGKPDKRLIRHNADGTLYAPAGSPIELLPEDFEFDIRMAELSDTSLKMQIEVLFKPTITKKASRRSTPVPSAVR